MDLIRDILRDTAEQETMDHPAQNPIELSQIEVTPSDTLTDQCRFRNQSQLVELSQPSHHLPWGPPYSSTKIIVARLRDLQSSETDQKRFARLEDPTPRRRRLC